MTQYLISLRTTPRSRRRWSTWTPTSSSRPRRRSADSWTGSTPRAPGCSPEDFTRIQTATTVDNSGDEPILTDGPFVEAKEYLGGFWVIEAPDLDKALEWAKDVSKALGDRIEVRAFQEAPD